MPLGLFGNKFTPKKTPPRRAQSLSNLNLDADQSRHEFGVDSYSGVKLNLGGQEVAFENGMWVTGRLDCSRSLHCMIQVFAQKEMLVYTCKVHFSIKTTTLKDHPPPKQ